jgi:hypothetical protein
MQLTSVTAASTVPCMASRSMGALLIANSSSVCWGSYICVCVACRAPAIYAYICVAHRCNYAYQTPQMATGRVHVCSVERHLEPRLADKLVALCGNLADILQRASNINESVRCVVHGAYLASATLKIDGYYHVNEDIVCKITEECEVAFGYGSTQVVLGPGTNVMTIYITFQEHPRRPKSWLTLFLFCSACVLGSCLLLATSPPADFVAQMKNFTKVKEM